jgi:uncharacterized protein
MIEDKHTVVVGASPDPDRYAYRCIISLQRYRHTVYGVGIKEGHVNGTVLLTNRPHIDNVHTVTLYVGPKHQDYWIPYILSLKPKRIIFNPGTENGEFFQKASEQGIECIEACTLVMLSVGTY